MRYFRDCCTAIVTLYRARLSCLLHIFFKYFVQTDKNEIVVPMHGVPAMQCHRSGETASYDDGQRLADLEKEAI